MQHRTEKWNLIWGTVALLLGRGALLVVPYIVGNGFETCWVTLFFLKCFCISTTQLVIDLTLSGNPNVSEELVKSILLLNGSIIVSAALSSINSFLYSVSGERIVTRLRQNLFRNVLTQEIAFFDESKHSQTKSPFHFTYAISTTKTTQTTQPQPAKTGELLNRLSSDCTILQDAATVQISWALRSLSTMAVSVVMIFYISWKLSLLILLFVPILGVVTVIYGRWIKKLSKSFQDALASATDTASGK